MPRLATVVLALVIAAAAFIACTSDQPAVIPTMTPAIEQPVESEPTLDTEELPAFEVVDPDDGGGAVEPTDGIAYPPGAKRGGVFVLNTGNTITPDPVIGDGLSGENLNSQWLISEVFSGLTKIVDDSAVAFQPDLAESYTVADDGTTYEFTLKKDLKFSDGTPVTAADFKWSWERALNPKTRSNRAAIVLGDIEGASEVIDGSTAELSGVEAIDDRVLRITLAEPKSHFLALLADPVASVLKPENVENWGVDWAAVAIDDVTPRIASSEQLPVGTGPFKIAHFRHYFGPVVMTRNEHFHEGPTYLDGVVLIHDLSDDFTGDFEAESFANEVIDMAFAADDESALTEYQLIENPPATSFMLLNIASEPLDDVRFRRALARSIDRTDLAPPEIINISAAHGISPPGFLPYETAIEPLERDLDAAMQDLGDSQYADWEEPLNLIADIFGYFEEELSILGQQWTETLGVNAVYTPMIGSRFLNSLGDGEWNFVGFYEIPDYPGPSRHLRRSRRRIP